MNIEKHNAHGMQLLVTMSPSEAIDLIEKLAKCAGMTAESNTNHYISLSCLFEDDNNEWVRTKFDVVVDSGRQNPCQPAYPCGKPVEKQGSIPAGPCDRQEGHENFCYRRNALPDYLS